MVRRLVLFGWALFCMLPLGTIVYLSIAHNRRFPVIWDSGWNPSWWMQLIDGQQGLWQSLLLSMFIACTISLTATASGFILSGQMQKKLQLIQLAYFPYLIAPVIFGVLLQYYFVRAGLTGSVPGVLLAQWLFIFPYSVLLFSTFWNEQVRQTGQQAATLGATPTRVYTKVWMPMARPWIVLSLLQCFLISWFEYGLTQVIGVGKVETLTIKTMFFVKEANPHLAGVTACLMILPVLLWMLLNRSLFKRKTLAP